MALGFTNKREGAVANAPPLTTGSQTEKPADLVDGYGGDSSPTYDAENLGRRKMSRIDKPLVKPIGANDVPSDDSSGMSVGQQMELEAGNAIKYRTCSWPKV